MSKSKAKLEDKRAVIVALHGKPDYREGVCTSTMPLVDRPFLQHLVECLVDRGIKEIDFLLHDSPRFIEKCLGDGERWGGKFTFHLVRDGDRPYSRLEKIRFIDRQDPILLLHADQIQPESWEVVTERSDDVLAYVSTDPEIDKAPVFCGAWIRPEFFSEIRLDAKREDFQQELLKISEASESVIHVGTPLSCAGFDELLVSQRRVLEREFPELIRFAGGAGEENVWVGRNVYMKSAGSEFEVPIFVGANCTVENNQRIGPNVVIRENSFVRGKCDIRDALILSDTLVGEGLSIDGCILDGHQLYNVKHNVLIDVHDELLMGSTRFTFKPLRMSRLFSQIVALLVLFLMSPMLAILMIRHHLLHGTSFRVEPQVSLPLQGTRISTFGRMFFDLGSGANTNWNHFWYQLLPGLINVLRGDIRLVGISPPSVKELQALSDEMHEAYEGCEAGLISESLVLYGPKGNADESQLADMYQAVATTTLKNRFRLLGSYVKSVFFGPSASRSKQETFTNVGLTKSL